MIKKLSIFVVLVFLSIGCNKPVAVNNAPVVKEQAGGSIDLGNSSKQAEPQEKPSEQKTKPVAPKFSFTVPKGWVLDPRAVESYSHSPELGDQFFTYYPSAINPEHKDIYDVTGGYGLISINFNNQFKTVEEFMNAGGEAPIANEQKEDVVVGGLPAVHETYTMLGKAEEAYLIPFNGGVWSIMRDLKQGTYPSNEHDTNQSSPKTIDYSKYNYDFAMNYLLTTIKFNK